MHTASRTRRSAVAALCSPTIAPHQKPLYASPSRLHRHLPHQDHPIFRRLVSPLKTQPIAPISSRSHRAMSTIPSAASPPTSPPAKRHKLSNSIAEVTVNSSSMSSSAATAAAENGNGTAVPTLEQSPPLLIKKLSDKARLPTRGSAFAAGYDLYAAKDTVIPKRGKVLVDTDIAIAVPAGTYGRIAPRSGLASKHFIDTGAGVIDADYRGQVKVLLFNHNEADFEVKEGDRVAQLIIERIYTPEVVEVAELEESVRGAGGFGSTGAN
ncbi:hypothetical protein TruAng_003199 [Truncatella angustata]|nr:hypothetical protein TruAng_003199 [Truncatella angustata]